MQPAASASIFGSSSAFFPAFLFQAVAGGFFPARAARIWLFHWRISAPIERQKESRVVHHRKGFPPGEFRKWREA